MTDSIPADPNKLPSTSDGAKDQNDLLTEPHGALRAEILSRCGAWLDSSRSNSVAGSSSSHPPLEGGAIVVEHGDLVIYAKRESLSELLTSLKEKPEFDFRMLVDITVVDWMDTREVRFEVVYQLLDIVRRRRLTVKVALGEDSPEIWSAVTLWRGANFMEREIWDMFGVRFVGHPDLRRILMYEEFKGHPLRKDYPVQAKQPRVPLRKPEVENTARQMKRSDLVAIRSRNRAAAN